MKVKFEKPDFTSFTSSGGPARTLLVNIAQDAPGCVHHVSNCDFWEQPISRHHRIQLCNQIKMNPLI